MISPYRGEHLMYPESAWGLGARVLGEFGDDPTRYVDAGARRNFAGPSPITKASGTRRVVLTRFARNTRLYDSCHR